MRGSDPMDAIDEMRTIVVGYVGPFAGFVVDKQMQDLHMPREDFTDEQMLELIERVVTNAIYDPNLQAEARRKLRKACRNGAGMSS